MKYYFLIISIFIVIIGLTAQPSFIGTATDFMEDNDLYSHVGLAVADLNDDGKDDIVGIDRNENVVIYYQMLAGEKYLRKATPIKARKPWSMIIGDINVDGSPEIVINTINEIIVAGKSGDMSYDIITRKSLGGIFPQSASMGDVDQDGYMELFLCNDLGINKMYRYDDVLQEITDTDFSTLLESDNSGNYGSVMSDVNGDGLLDIFVAKCSVFVPDDATDPRRINQLFLSGVDGMNQIENAVINDGAQSWSVDTGDIDNDGDLDIFYTNHGSPHVLLINENGTFRRSEAFFTTSNSLQSVVIDMNLDGWNDIVISSGNLVEVYYNQGNEEFIYTSFPVEGTGIFSMTIGDINGDGWPDIYGSKSNDNTFNELNGRDRVGINHPDVKHDDHLKIVLDQRADVCGTKVEVYSGGSSVPYQMKEIKCGHSYGITTSAALLYGGLDAAVDSVVVHWYGSDRVVYAVESRMDNETLRLYENGHQEWVQEEVVFLCDGFATLQGYNNDNIWSTGQVGEGIIVNSPGIYTVCYMGAEEVEQRKKHFYVYDMDLKDTDLIASRDSIYSCPGSDVVLTKNTFPGTFYWSTDEEDASIEVQEPGVYTLNAVDNCGGTEYQDSVRIIMPDIPEGRVDTVRFTEPGVYEIPVEGQDVRWYTGDTTIHSDTFSGDFPVGETTLEYDMLIDRVEEAQSYGVIETSNTFTYDEINSGIYLRVHRPCIMHSVDVYGEEAGLRRILLQDMQGNIVLDRSVVIDTGYQKVDLEFRIEQAGQYYLTTDKIVNQVELGHGGPGLSRTQNVNFPLRGDVLDMLYSGNGEILYPYFYNMQVSEITYACRSAINTLVVVVSKPDNVNDESLKEISLYPNPGTGLFHIETDQEIEGVVVFNAIGQRMTYIWQRKSLEMNVPAGIYYVRVKFTDGSTVMEKIMVR